MYPINTYPLGLFQSVINDILYQNLQKRPSLGSIQERMHAILLQRYGNCQAIKDLVQPDAKLAAEALALEEFLNVVASTETKTLGGTILDIIQSYLMSDSSGAASSSSSQPLDKLAVEA